jgi:hypothetical protein
MTDPAERPFSVMWTIASIILFLAVELAIGTFIGPIIIGKYVPPTFHYEVQMLMHLLAFFLGGLTVGVVSPGRRLIEPALGGFLSVVLVFLMGVFMPTWFFTFNLGKVLVGGGIGFFLALLGAWQGEKFMGNLDTEEDRLKQPARAKFRAALWTTEDDSIPAPPPERTRE